MVVLTHTLITAVTESLPQALKRRDVDLGLIFLQSISRQNTNIPDRQTDRQIPTLPAATPNAKADGSDANHFLLSTQGCVLGGEEG